MCTSVAASVDIIVLRLDWSLSVYTEINRAYHQNIGERATNDESKTKIRIIYNGHEASLSISLSFSLPSLSIQPPHLLTSIFFSLLKKTIERVMIFRVSESFPFIICTIRADLVRATVSSIHWPSVCFGLVVSIDKVINNTIHNVRRYSTYFLHVFV